MYKVKGIGIWYFGFESCICSRLRVGEGTLFPSPWGISGLWATWVSMSDFPDILTAQLSPSDVIERCNDSMMIYGFHGNQRSFLYWALQTKFQDKRCLSCDGKREDDGSESQGPALSRNVILTSFPRSREVSVFQGHSPVGL